MRSVVWRPGAGGAACSRQGAGGARVGGASGGGGQRPRPASVAVVAGEAPLRLYEEV